MLNKQNNEKIKIAILEVSDQNKAILEFYFSTAGKSLYKEVSKSEATAFITDYDYPGAKEHWEETSKTTSKPGLILSISEKNIPSTVWLPKPLTAKAVSEAAAKIRELMNFEEPAEALVAETPIAETLVNENQPVSELIQQSKTLNESFNEDFEGEITDTFEAVIGEELNEPIIEASTQETAVEITAKVQETIKEPEFENELAMVGTDASISLSSEDTDIQKFVDIEPVQAEQSQTIEFSDTKNEPVDSSVITDEQQLVNISASEVIDEGQESTELTKNEEIDALLESLILGEGRKKQAAIAKTDEASELTIDEFQAPAEETNVATESPDQDLTTEPLVLDDTTRLDHEDSFSAEDTFSIEEFKATDDSLPIIENAITTSDDFNSLTEDTTNDSSKVDLHSLDLLVPEIPNQDALSTTVDSDIESDLFDFNLETALPGESKPNSKIVEDDGSLLELLDHREDENSDHDDTITDTEIFVDKPSIEDEIVNEDIIINQINALESGLDENIDLDLGIQVPVIETKAPQTADNELQSLLNELRTEADKSSVNKKAKSSKFTYGEKPKNQQKSAHEKTNAEKRWVQLCGENDDIRKVQDLKEISYTLNKHMLSVLLDQINQAKSSVQVLRLKHDDVVIVIDIELDSIYCNYPVEKEEYSDFCFDQVNLENIKVHELDASEVRMYRKLMEDEPNTAHSIESFIWTTSLLTSRGRLLEHTDITKKISLKAWPDMTRVEKTPHAMNIAAVFSKHPGSLQEVPKWLNIPQRYVFAFYNAAMSLEMVEFDSSKFKTSAFTFNTSRENTNAKERGFFGRLLKRLTA